jgi:hypothetical protein
VILSEISRHIKEGELHLVIKDGKIVEVSGTLKLDKVYTEDIGDFLDCVRIYVEKCSNGVCKAEIDYRWC